MFSVSTCICKGKCSQLVLRCPETFRKTMILSIVRQKKTQKQFLCGQVPSLSHVFKLPCFISTCLCPTVLQLVKNPTNKFLQNIPSNGNNSNVSMLVIEDNNITLNEKDQQALSGYPKLVELHLGGNLVATVPASYFSGLSHLRVLSLARNGITR